MRPTMKDVSKASGLSIYTVSRALNGGDEVSEASRQAVLEAARELGYVPNKAAQQLRKQTKSSIAVITASTSNYYYIDLMNGIQRTLQPSGRRAIIADIAAGGVHTQELEDATVRELVQSRTAGIISTLTLSQTNTQLLRDWDIPLVFVDSKPPDSDPDLPAVTMDNLEGSTQVAEHLVSHGYRRWLFLAYPSRWSTRADRERGLRQVADAHDIKFEVVESPNDPTSARQTLGAHLADSGRALPDVIIASNNPMIHGTYQVVRELGMRAPADVAIVGYDDFAWAPLLDPPLTVLDEDSDHIGVLAAQTLTKVIDEQAAGEARGEPTHPVYRPEDRVQVHAELIVRSSCGC